MSYTINISLPKNLAQLAKDQVKSGYYSSVSELIRETLRNSLMTSNKIPTFTMSPDAEKIAIQAKQNYLKGKSIKLNNINDLDNL